MFKKIFFSPRWLWAEMILVFLVLPIAFIGIPNYKWVFTALWVIVFISLAYMMWVRKQTIAQILNHSAVTWINLKTILLRFVMIAPFLVLFTYLYKPEWMFGFISRLPWVWLAVMFIYPVLSALPQEMVFRTFFMDRYKTILPTPLSMGLINTFVFALAHVFLQNWVAVVFSGLGSILFFLTYQKTRSLLLVTIEHALYGCFIFTVGLGRFFYGGGIGNQ